MGTQEWLLLGAVLVVPLVVAIGVTLWTLEQAIKRNRKNQRGRVTRRVSEPVVDGADSGVGVDAAVAEAGDTNSTVVRHEASTRSDTKAGVEEREASR